jgi:hypothetical protein
MSHERSGVIGGRFLGDLNRVATCHPQRDNSGMGELTEQRVKRLRHVFGRLLIDILRLVDQTRLRSGKLTSDELTIALAVIACEGDGRPPTVNKLSHYLGISRTTATRYVERMIRDGHLKRSDGHLFLAYPVDSIAVDNARRLLALINKAFSEVSKMDD